MATPNLVRFDWAMKRLLRQKANFVILEGFLSELLQDDIKIVNLLESEGNKENEDDKFNRVDLLAEDSKKRLVLIEVQNTRQVDYFLRMLYGTSKLVTEYINEGDKYGDIRKIYSVNIVYFDFGQGSDYVYHGTTDFKGIHTGDLLLLSPKQRETFMTEEPSGLYPEYYVLRVNEFDKHAATPLDEWIRFFKTGDISKKVSARGLQEAQEKLKFNSLPKKDQVAYLRHVENMRIQRSVIDDAREEGLKEGLAEGKAKGLAEGRAEGRAEGEHLKQIEIAKQMKKNGIPSQIIHDCTGLDLAEIDKI